MHNILVPAGIRPGADLRLLQAGVCELGVIPGGQAAALGVERFKVGQLDPQQAGLQFVQPAVARSAMSGSLVVRQPASPNAPQPLVG